MQTKCASGLGQCRSYSSQRPRTSTVSTSPCRHYESRDRPRRDHWKPIEARERERHRVNAFFNSLPAGEHPEYEVFLPGDPDCPELSERGKSQGIIIRVKDLKGTNRYVHRTWLRDACQCSRCVDPNTGLKKAYTHAFPEHLPIASAKFLKDGSLSVSWSNDIYTDGNNHLSTYPPGFFTRLYLELAYQRMSPEPVMFSRPRILWNRAIMERALVNIP